jgi:hypothetical protein
MRPFPPGDPPKPFELEAIIEEEDEMEGSLATHRSSTINRIRKIADDLLLSEELQEGSCARRDVPQIRDVAHYSRRCTLTFVCNDNYYVFFSLFR